MFHWQLVEFSMDTELKAMLSLFPDFFSFVEDLFTRMGNYTRDDKVNIKKQTTKPARRAT